MYGFWRIDDTFSFKKNPFFEKEWWWMKSITERRKNSVFGCVLKTLFGKRKDLSTVRLGYLELCRGFNELPILNKTTDTSNNNSERLQTLRVRIRWARMYLYSLSKDPVTFYQTYIDLFRLSAAHIMCFDWIGIDIWEVSCNWEHITWS